MAQLNEQEAKELERLTKKREAPDPEPISRHVSFNVDLGKKDQIEMARKLGLINDQESESESEETEGEGEDWSGRKPDKVPRRGGYFGASA